MFLKTVEALQEGRLIDERIDYATLYCFNGFTSAARSKRLELWFQDIQLTSSYASNITSLLEPASSAFGSVSGRLEAITVHNENKFVLYPALPNEHISCSFENDVLGKVLQAVTQNVTVFGTLHYAQSKVLPVRVDVENFEIEPNDDTLPNLIESRGAFLQHPPFSSDSGLTQDFANGW